MGKTVAGLIGAVLLARGWLEGAASVPADPALSPVATVEAGRFLHETGRPGSRGWEADQRIHRPGLLLDGPDPALLASPGAYRATLHLRRGTYPDRGLLKDAQRAVRFDIIDAAGKSVIASRELDASELPQPNRYENRWIEFTIPPGEDVLLTFAVYWHGSMNLEVESVRLDRIPVASPAALAARAERLRERVRRHHLENGFVVSRKNNGDPDETGDAATYTGFYAAALAWELQVARSDRAEQDLENAMAALHAIVKGSADKPVLARFVDEDGAPHPESPSKDVYTSFFFASAMAYPQIRNETLRAQIRTDVRRIANRLLKDGLVVRGGDTLLASLAPHYTAQDIRRGVNKLVTDKRRAQKAAKALRRAGNFAPFQPLWPGMKEVLKAIERRDEDSLVELALPTADGVIVLANRVISVLREHGRRDLIGPRLNRSEPPALRLANLLTTSLRKLPPAVNGRRFRQPSDLRFLASNALIALHVMKTAAVITGDPTFEEYYRNNLYAQDALLQTALDWHGLDDEFLRATGGNHAAASERRGYLALLSLYNLYELETNPAVKEKYRTLLAREAAACRHDDNPLVAAIATACGAGGDPAPVAKALSLYPDEPDGFGDRYWVLNGKEVAERLGSGTRDGFSMEPLPVSHRPRDSFLWQRNVLRIVGDHDVSYPGADYGFLYWLARRHNLIEAPETTRSSAQAPRP